VSAESPAALFDQRFVVLVLWLCVGGALWLLLSPAAFQRRALIREVARVEANRQTELDRHRQLKRWRDGLESDPSVIERQARNLGYGRPNERSYRALTPGRNLPDEATWRRSLYLARGAWRNQSWSERIRGTVGPVLAAIAIGAALYFIYRIWKFRKSRYSANSE